MRRVVVAAIVLGLAATAVPAQAAPRFPTAKSAYALKGQQVKALVRSGKVVIAGTGTGVFRSPDGGKTWKRAGLSDDVTDLAVDQASPSAVYAGSGTSLHRSDDAGKSWTLLPAVATAGRGVDVITTIAARGSQVVVGADDGLSLSADRGQTWTSPALTGNGGTPATLNHVAIQGSTGRVWIAGRYLGVGVSSDGQRFSFVNESLPYVASVGGSPSQWNALSVFFPQATGSPVFVTMCGAEVYSLRSADVGRFAWEDRGSPRAGDKTVSCAGFAPQQLTRRSFALANRVSVGICNDDDGCFKLGQVKGSEVLSVALGDPVKKGAKKRVLIGTTKGLTFLELPRLA
jgi:hypothetical protein